MSGLSSFGGGGGSGEIARGVFSSATIGASQTVTIGAAGGRALNGPLASAVTGGSGTAGIIIITEFI